MDRDEPRLGECVSQAPQVGDSRMSGGMDDRERDPTGSEPRLRPLAGGLGEIAIPLRPERPRAREATRPLELSSHRGAVQKSDPRPLPGEFVREDASAAN